MQNFPKILVIETSANLGSAALAVGPQLIKEQSFTANFKHASQLLPTLEALCRSQNWSSDEIDQLYISVGPGSFTGLRIAVTFAKTFAYARQIQIVPVPSTDAAALNALSAGQTIAWQTIIAGECSSATSSAINTPSAGQTQYVGQTQHSDVQYAAVVIDAKRKQVYTAAFEIVGRVNNSENNLPKTNICLPGHVAAAQEALPSWLTFDDRFTPGLRHLFCPAAMTPTQLLELTPRPLCILGEGLPHHREALTAPGVVHLPDAYGPPRASAVHQCGWLRAQAGLFVDPDFLSPLYLRRPEAVERWEKLHPETTHS